MRGPVRAFAVFASMLLVGACSSDTSTSPEATPATGGGELVVFAASSLGAAFTEIGDAFESANPGLAVTLNFGPSDSLAGQIGSEATADVFASASGTWMDAVAENPGVTGRVDFATNQLVLVTPADNPADVQSIDDLAHGGVQLVLAAEGVPVGDYAREALDNAGILQAASANIVSNEEDAAAVVARVDGGEADAAIVYTSDVSAAAGNDLHAIEILDSVNVLATYPIAIVTGSVQTDLAAKFIQLVTGAEGQATLARYGFGPAP
jgi:molybdate transport system substrate-binding protein